jgi:hypothetical protein
LFELFAQPADGHSFRRLPISSVLEFPDQGQRRLHDEPVELRRMRGALQHRVGVPGEASPFKVTAV